MTEQKLEEERILGILAYLSVLVLVPFLMKEKSDFVRYHTKQGLVLFGGEIILGILSGIPILGWFIIAPLGWLAALVLTVIGIWNVLEKRSKPLPLIGPWAEKIKL